MAEIRQYVNLPGTTGNLGNTINLRVSANQVPNVHPWWQSINPPPWSKHGKRRARQTQPSLGARMFVLSAYPLRRGGPALTASTAWIVRARIGATRRCL